MDPRAAAAAYYDLAPDFPPDVPFYLRCLPTPATTVLELGCGTGRVSVELAPHAAFLHGVDLSSSMAVRGEARLRAAGIAPNRALITLGDITQLQLGVRFDLIIAPFRVFQNLTTEAQIAGLFATVRAHLAPGGRCILNTFRPYADPATLVASWSLGGEDLDWEVPIEGGRVACYVRRAGVTADPLILYPELIYRRYRGGAIVDEAVSRIMMRCWYPDEFLARLQSEGFAISEQWGGYAREPYGTGSELVVAFADA